MEQTKTPPIETVQQGFNYRRRFNAQKMAELVEDIKRQGVLQPIIVRSQVEGNATEPGKTILIKISDIKAGLYQVVAGHRRTRATDIVFGDEGEIPAMVRVMTDAEAMAAMVSENKIREDTSAIEDAEAAARMLGLLKGDKDETARRLGWTRNMLDRRLALMNATQSVRDAYIDDKIQLGHVEILAAMRREAQDQVITKMLAAPKVPTVEQLKAMAEQVLMSLEAAIFNKEQCAGCQFNTGIQQAMFDTAFEGSRCTNKECYEKKTDDELEMRRNALTETYQVVRIVRTGDNLTVVPLRAEGPKGVGADQALACRTCADFGACVSASPDKLGMTFKDVCFNSTCNNEKIAARMKAEKEHEQKENPTPQASGNAKGNPGASNGGASQTKPKGGNQSTKKASSEPRNAVKEYRENIWRLVFNRAAVRLPVEKSRALLIALCLYRPRTLDSLEAAKAVAKALEKESIQTRDAGELMNSLLALDQKGLSASLQQIPAYVSKELEIGAICKMLAALEIDIAHFWKINETFLDLLTKTEIDAVCIELGVNLAMGNEYAKLKNGSKPEFMKAILAVEGFDFKGKIPALMRW